MIVSLIIGTVGVVIIVGVLIVLPNMKQCPKCKSRFCLDFESHTAAGEVYKCRKCGNSTY
jgi:predicted Zn finger-like uncharacterized protein